MRSSHRNTDRPGASEGPPAETDQAADLHRSRSSDTGPGWPCFCRHEVGIKMPYFIPSGATQVIGRADDCDFRVDHTSLSRQHLQVWSGGEAWWVRDLGSTNGTHVDQRPLDTEPVRLQDGSTLHAGSVAFTFYVPDGHYQTVVRQMITDQATGLLNRELLVTELDRAQRLALPRRLAAFDIDRYRDVRQMMDPVKAMGAVQRLASALHEAVVSSFGEEALIAANDEDTFVALVPDHGQEECSLWVETARQQLGEAISGDIDISLSAALVSVPHRSPREWYPEHVLEQMAEKLTQAKLAGKARSATSPVQTLWDKKNEQQWRARLPSMSSVAVGWYDAQEPAAALKTQETIRKGLARALDTLPRGTRVSIAWRDSGYWLIAADCAIRDLKPVLEEIEGLRVAASPVRNAPEEWVDGLLAQLEARQPSSMANTNHVLAQIQEEYQAADWAEQFDIAANGFEKALQILGNLLIARAAWEYVEAQQDQSSKQWKTLVSTVAKLQGTAAGAGTWLHAIEEMLRVLPAGSVPQELTQKAKDGWLGRLHEAVSKRNWVTHNPVSTEDRQETAQSLWARICEIAEGMPVSELKLIAIERSKTIRGWKGWSKVAFRELAGPFTPALRTENIEDTLDEGVWIRTRDHWIPVSPLLVYDRCPQCNRFEMFSARGFPRPDEKLSLVGTLHPHMYETVFHDDAHELKTLAEAAAATRKQPPSSRQDNRSDETGLHETHGPRRDDPS